LSEVVTDSNPKFMWISNRSAEEYISIDKHQRLYISVAARKMLDLPDGEYRLIAGYDFANHRIVLAKPEIVNVPNVEPYKFDKRNYAHVKNFVERANLKEHLPLRFYYSGKDYSEYPRGAYAFTLEDYNAEDV